MNKSPRTRTAITNPMQLHGNKPARRVLHLSATNFFGGPEKQIIGHALAVDRRRYTVSIAAFSEGRRDTDLVIRAREAGVECWSVPVRNAYDPRALRRTARLLAREQIDILVTHNYRSNLLGRHAAHAHGIPHLAVSRGWTRENLKVRFYHWLDKKTLGSSECIVCVSRDKKDELSAAGIPASRLVVIPNAVQTDRHVQPATNWRDRFGWDATTQLVVSAGRLSHEKGPDLFLAAASRIRYTCPQARFILFGEGPMADVIRRQAEDRQLAGVVGMAGYLPELERELPAFDLLVNPSRMEGLPNIVLEAMAAHLPVVATDVGGVREIIIDGQTGRLVRADVASLAEAMRLALSQQDLAKQYAERAYEHVRENYSFAAQAERYAEVYDRLCVEGLTRRRE